MAEPLVVAVDGGNSKTDVVLADAAGRVRSWVRGPGTRPQAHGMPAMIDGVAELVLRARADAEAPVDARIAAAAVHLANVDLPADEQHAMRELLRHNLSDRVIVRNDSFAVLLAGSPDGWGVAIVSGAGINGLGVAPDGRQERFLALGAATGDWGGGQALGEAALGAAVRAGDGRGEPTELRSAVADHFGAASPEAVAIAVARNEIPRIRLMSLAPVLYGVANAGDAVAGTILRRLADEVVVMVTALLRRLNLFEEPTPVVLGGGTLRHAPPLLLDHLLRGLGAAAPRARPVVLAVPPVAGPLTEALRTAGAGRAAIERAVEGLRAAEPG